MGRFWIALSKFFWSFTLIIFFIISLYVGTLVVDFGELSRLGGYDKVCFFPPNKVTIFTCIINPVP